MTEKKTELRRNIKSVRWMIFWVVLAQFAAEVVVEAVFSFIENPPHRYVRVAIVELFAIGVPIMLYARSARGTFEKDVKEEFGMNGCRISLLLLAAALGVCSQFVMILLNLPFNAIFETPVDTSVEAVADSDSLALGIFAVVLIPAVLEEFWMRGIIFSAYNKGNTVAAIFFTSLMFAFLHMSLNDLPGFVFMGIVASVVMIKCNSLYAAMVYHGLSNLTALLLGTVILPSVGDNVWLVFVLAVLGFFVLFAFLLIQKGKVKINKVFKPGKLVVNSIFSLPVILSFAVALVKYFLSGGN